MATHMLMPLDQRLLPASLATAFGLEQSEAEGIAQLDSQRQALPAELRGGQPGCVGHGGFMAPLGMPQAALAVQHSTAPGYEQAQLNGAAAIMPQQAYAVPPPQSVPPATGAQPRSAAASGRGAAAHRTDSQKDPPVAMTKKPRVAWTSDLHKRFVDAVTELGVHTAVPKAIMTKMNVEGLTRENVASHLQKYRLQLKREQD